ncbi:hypothetical protein N7462_003649 [Penicillium macrosclerotiorum]|uniref:uncharacterized protein n=1 Tax=Penicillium macrosclerotiorum TaxID=303699 RepID=UPI0025496982|nr:uncharacterized protein N7462_003649 [Penicillium macrosclerotiorum]KAJ5689257.1 hypothetical protein N7462_003649 [Penicillium macrosclerotiorum]
MSEDWAHIVFVARLSSGERGKVNAVLRDSLNHTMNCYELIYGPIECTTEFLTFAHQSNLPLAPQGEVDRFFTRAINCAKATKDGKLLVVMNGWDGLTTDPGSFMSIFRPDASRVTIRVFAEVPRSFWHVNVEQAIKVLDGTIRINPYIEGLMSHEAFDQETKDRFLVAEAQLEYSTADFCRKLTCLQAIKMNWSGVKQQLQKVSSQRNTDPASTRNLDKWKCPEPNCGKAFPGYNVYYAHRRVHLGETTKFRCRYCDQPFTRHDTRDRHQAQTCSKRTGQELVSSRPKRPKAIRGSRPVQTLAGMPRSSDSSVDYYRLSPEHIKDLPRLELDRSVLDTLPLIDKRCDVIYKGELYCRWPECATTTRYTSTSKLRVHYKNAHGHEFLGFKAGVLDAGSQQKHIQGLLWLTKAALHGKENAGHKPYPQAQ